MVSVIVNPTKKRKNRELVHIYPFFTTALELSLSLELQNYHEAYEYHERLTRILILTLYTFIVTGTFSWL